MTGVAPPIQYKNATYFIIGVVTPIKWRRNSIYVVHHIYTRMYNFYCNGNNASINKRRNLYYNGCASHDYWSYVMWLRWC